MRWLGEKRDAKMYGDARKTILSMSGKPVMNHCEREKIKMFEVSAQLLLSKLEVLR